MTTCVNARIHHFLLDKLLVCRVDIHNTWSNKLIYFPCHRSHCIPYAFKQGVFKSGIDENIGTKSTVSGGTLSAVLWLNWLLISDLACSVVVSVVEVWAVRMTCLASIALRLCVQKDLSRSQFPLKKKKETSEFILSANFTITYSHGGSISYLLINFNSLHVASRASLRGNNSPRVSGIRRLVFPHREALAAISWSHLGNKQTLFSQLTLVLQTKSVYKIILNTGNSALQPPPLLISRIVRTFQLLCNLWDVVSPRIKARMVACIHPY